MDGTSSYWCRPYSFYIPVKIKPQHDRHMHSASVMLPKGSEGAPFLTWRSNR